ncbi:MAG: glycosyltransferase family protein [Polyangiales bacterium]
MRILYGVVGEGMGHATRSKVTLEWLLAHGHHVKVVVSNRAYGFLEKTFGSSFPRVADAPEGIGAIDVVEIEGLVMKYVDNAFDDTGSVLHNVLRAPGLIAENVGAYYEDIVRWKPQAVISDFDSFAYLFGKIHRLPILSIDNQQVVQRCEIPDAAKDVSRADYRAIKAFVKAKLPACDHYIITGFFYPEIREKYQDKTTLVPPILRQAIIEATPTPAIEAKHFLVYQTSKSDTTLIPTLEKWGEKCIVYGLGRDEQIGNVTLKPFSEQGFVDDLASSRGVISNGGLSLLNEAVSLHKPVFSVPVRKQYEQVLNSWYLDALGYGRRAGTINEADLRAFAADVPKHAKALESFQHDSNAKLFATVEKVLGDFEGEAFHREVHRGSSKYKIT